ncbi:hypothetical protein, partial [Rickettsia conorii]|uniref:hypothetical protein n=1 Tax=Rickettsia conorii TaxID=781 RepID=UPI0029CAB899
IFDRVEKLSYTDRFVDINTSIRQNCVIVTGDSYHEFLRYIYQSINSLEKGCYRVLGLGCLNIQSIDAFVLREVRNHKRRS